jgi:hypothetical protein
MKYAAHGKQVKRGDEHIADAVNEHESTRIVAALNAMPPVMKCWDGCGCVDQCLEIGRRMKIISDKIMGEENAS